MSGEEHQVVGEYPKPTSPPPGLTRPGPEGAPEPPLVPAERGLGLPPLAVHPAVPAAPGLLPEPPDHLPPVRGLRPPPAPVAAGPRGDGGAGAGGLPAVTGGGVGGEGGGGPPPGPGGGGGRPGPGPGG